MTFHLICFVYVFLVCKMCISRSKKKDPSTSQLVTLSSSNFFKILKLDKASMLLSDTNILHTTMLSSTSTKRKFHLKIEINRAHVECTQMWSWYANSNCVNRSYILCIWLFWSDMRKVSTFIKTHTRTCLCSSKTDYLRWLSVVRWSNKKQSFNLNYVSEFCFSAF